MMKQAIALLGKDLQLEWRQKHSLYGLFLYVAATLFVLYFSLGEEPAQNLWVSLYWVFILFVCVNSIAKSFLQESKGRMLYYYTLTSAKAFIISKLLYGIILMFVLNAITFAAYQLFFGSPLPKMGLFFYISTIGSIGLSMIFTLMSAIAAKAQQNAALVAILGFPVILPLLMMLNKLSKITVGEVFRDNAVLQLSLILLGYYILIFLLATILYPFLWKD